MNADASEIGRKSVLEFLLGSLSDGEVADDSFSVNKKTDWKHLSRQPFVALGIATKWRKRRWLVLEDFPHPSSRLRREGYHRKLIPELRLEGLKCGHFRPAGAAPGMPEVNDENSPAKIRKSARGIVADKPKAKVANGRATRPRSC